MLKSLRYGFFVLIGLMASVAYAGSWQIGDYQTTTQQNFRQNALFLEEIDFDRIDFPRLHAAVFYVTNEVRLQHKLPAVGYVPQLERAAWGHSNRMVEYNFFSHQDPKSRKLRTVKQRGKVAGIKNPTIAENILTTFGIQYKPGTIIHTIDDRQGLISYTAGGAAIPAHTYLSLAQDAVNQWMNSSGHRANILSKQALQLGVGAAFYREPNFKNVAHFKITQNFQWHQPIST